MKNQNRCARIDLKADSPFTREFCITELSGYMKDSDIGFMIIEMERYNIGVPVYKKLSPQCYAAGFIFGFIKTLADKNLIASKMFKDRLINRGFK